MNLPYFIAHRLIKGRREGTSFSRPINVIAIVGIAMGLAVMILAVAILTGFKKTDQGESGRIWIAYSDHELRFKYFIRDSTNQ